VEMLSTYNLGIVVMAIASVTILVGSCIALSQDELKRRLAYSTISQLSYIVFGVALLSPQGLLGGVIHIVMHAFGKITLFFCAGAIYVATRKKYISQMSGLGKKMPFTFAAFFIGALGVIGLPPTGGFYSKWNLILGTREAQQTIFMIVLLLSSFLNAFYFLPIVYNGFFGKSEEEDENTPVKIQEANLCLVIPLMITAIISIALFFYPTVFINLVKVGLGI
ncbi:MAG: monovalent cation/H+ antiporter subunit D family protein, partial [Proteobacteria bacterium]|nr:monovalent cation/H+ antiporter subunit D family protein [Pseudomonadota bacterium]